MIRSDDSYETPKFDRFKSQASSSLNKDLFTVRRPPPKKQVKKKPQQVEKKYGVSISKATEKMQSKTTLYQIKERKENAR